MGASVSAAGSHSTAPPPSNIVFNSSPTTPKEDKYSAEPNYGFEGKQRKERVPPMTLAEMASAKIEPKYRDFCVHKLTALKKCNKDNFPWTMPCANARHALFECQYEDYLIRMKEYERERRLLHRKQRKEAALKKKEHC
ncbi:NADH dehydrogenase [ubiquinone] 1 beta subcomplex subunit 7 [Folsomia candida]|uniref:NADH dehydrogenase [ubiquinone] 1 beta subcomplex subunit 7 n=1 Tax=Folsomia candida TaxID=158441 RepID=A0A226EFU0_FOLCA|nr:NADH dehydrogenase [ubiquinone] 1 beta subcomplex subunit 7 [Folsomia candida]OXA56269.1 NADH dehydrogenase [ubiquinone] 1 beta subcomplex subunit 7 [Folsomia candida]